MSDLDALLSAIDAHPGEDTPRLVLADLYDERGGPGDADRAEFIRVQCRIAALDAELMSDEDCEHPTCPGCVERRALRRRERGVARRGFRG